MHPTVLFRDPWLLAVDKPSGLPSQSTRDPHRDHLLAAIARLPDPPADGPWLHHRLDAETSGVLLLAIHPDANAGLTHAFRERLAHKTYHALCAPTDPQAALTPSVDNHLKRTRSRGRDLTTATHSGGQRAITHLERLPAPPPLAHVRATPLTGRTHQIRVHLADAGFPILGDRLYGTHIPRSLATRTTRLLLHAARLELPHPVTGAPLTIEAPLPEAFTTLLQPA